MLYSDNVPVEKEVEIKKAAAEKGLLVMGPTAAPSSSGVGGLGMANACPPGP
jgi:FdrA protein